MDRHNDFAANTTDDRVKFNMPFDVLLLYIDAEVIIGASNLNAFWDIFAFVRLSGLELDSSWQIHK